MDEEEKMPSKRQKLFKALRKKHTRGINSVYAMEKAGLEPDEQLSHELKMPMIPFKQRDEQLIVPDAELLRVLLRYMSTKFPQYAHQFDGTALIALGVLMEHWIDEMIGQQGHTVFAEYANGTKKKSKKNPIHHEERGPVAGPAGQQTQEENVVQNGNEESRNGNEESRNDNDNNNNNNNNGGNSNSNNSE